MTDTAIIDRLAVAIQDTIRDRADDDLLVGAEVRIPRADGDTRAWETALLKRLAAAGIERVALTIHFGADTPELVSTRFEPGWS